MPEDVVKKFSDRNLMVRENGKERNVKTTT